MAQPAQISLSEITNEFDRVRQENLIMETVLAECLFGYRRLPGPTSDYDGPVPAHEFLCPPSMGDRPDDLYNVYHCLPRRGMIRLGYFAGEWLSKSFDELLNLMKAPKKGRSLSLTFEAGICTVVYRREQIVVTVRSLVYKRAVAAAAVVFHGQGSVYRPRIVSGEKIDVLELIYDGETLAIQI